MVLCAGKSFPVKLVLLIVLHKFSHCLGCMHVEVDLSPHQRDLLLGITPQRELINRSDDPLPVDSFSTHLFVKPEGPDIGPSFPFHFEEGAVLKPPAHAALPALSAPFV